MTDTAFQREITCAVRTKYYALGARNDTRTQRTRKNKFCLDTKGSILKFVKFLQRLTLIDRMSYRDNQGIRNSCNDICSVEVFPDISQTIPLAKVIHCMS